MGDYTDIMEEQIWQEYGDDDIEPEEAILFFFNEDGTFRNFGDALIEIINQTGKPIDKENAVVELKKYCSESEVPVSDIASLNTLKSWFNGGPRPKRSDSSRDSMFALAFACGMNIGMTEDLFHKAYLDRAFNYRNYKELIYYYCLKNHFSWMKVKELISMVDDMEDNTGDQTVYTASIQQIVDNIQDEDEVVRYINQHKHNFMKRNVQAKEILSELLSEARVIVAEELQDRLNEEANVWQNEIQSEYKGIWSQISNNTIYRIITDLSPSGKTGTVTVLKKAMFPKEIKNVFPEAQSLNGNYSSYEELRKTIILLFSYVFWRKAIMVDNNDCYDDYIMELNTIMAQAGFSELYAGNPYDWMFMYCAQTDEPINSFRSILQSAVYGDCQ